MDPRELQKGRCYFLVGYLDRQFKLPFIDTYVFLGSEEDREDVWVFQDVHSFSKQGENWASDESKGIQVLELDREGLETILDADGLADELHRLGV